MLLVKQVHSHNLCYRDILPRYEGTHTYRLCKQCYTNMRCDNIITQLAEIKTCQLEAMYLLFPVLLAMGRGRQEDAKFLDAKLLNVLQACFVFCPANYERDKSSCWLLGGLKRVVADRA